MEEIAKDSGIGTEQADENNVKEAVQTVNISLAILMGLPASGKTTLARKISTEYPNQETSLILITFDDFVPHVVQAKCTSLAENSAAKLLRKNFIHCVEFIVVQLRTPRELWCNNDSVCSFQERLVLPDGEENFLMSKSCFVKKVVETFKALEVETTGKHIQNFVLVIDDNNYYTSMRNEFYQIAKTYHTGFCILYCKTSLRTCRKRNSEREEQYKVPEKSIVEMSIKLEEPNLLANPCDTFCVIIAEDEDQKLEQDNIPLVVRVINNSIKFPVDWTPPPDRSEEIARERRICSQNEIHQADQVLRKWINKELILSSFINQKPGGGDSDNKHRKKEFSKDLSRRKTLVLEKLRNGEFTILAEVSQDIEFRNEVIKLAESLTEPT